MEINTLRDALIAKNGGRAVRSYRSRKITALSPGMQAQAEQLAAAASGLSSLDAAFKLGECGELDPWGGNKACGIAACPRCFMNYRRKETAISIRKRFPGVPNERLAFVTVLLEPTQNLSNVLPLFDAEKRRMRNMADRKCREDDRWGDVQWVTWLEVDRMSVSDLEDAGRNTRVYFENAAIYPVLDATRTIWRPHIHGIVELGDLTAKEFADTLRVYGHVTPYQVDVKPFDVSRPVEENLRYTTRYCLKFRIEEGFKGKPSDPDGEPSDNANAGRNWWCRADIEAFVGWLATCRGFQKLRFSRKKKIKSSGDISSSSSETELRSDVKEDICNKIVTEALTARYEYTLQDTNWLPDLDEERYSFDGRSDLIAADHLEACANHVIVPLSNALDDQGRQSLTFAADMAEAALRADRWDDAVRALRNVLPPTLRGPEGLIERQERIVRCGNGCSARIGASRRGTSVRASMAAGVRLCSPLEYARAASGARRPLRWWPPRCPAAIPSVPCAADAHSVFTAYTRQRVRP